MKPLCKPFYPETGKRGKSGSSAADKRPWMQFAAFTKKRRLERSSCSSREASDANYFLLGETVKTGSTSGINTA
jgi:hypothetical protein